MKIIQQHLIANKEYNILLGRINVINFKKSCYENEMIIKTTLKMKFIKYFIIIFFYLS